MKVHPGMKLREFVNRKQRDTYNKTRLAALTGREAEEDRIACALLACNYSRIHGDTKSAQSLIQMDCVAACFVNGGIWVASNSLRLEPEDIDEAIGTEYYGNDVYIVKNGEAGKHAEMQLLDELRESGMLKNVSYIGVSKPCCRYCKRVLDLFNIGYLQYHTDDVRHWEAPWPW